jgi:DNA-binding response OmpR family regulator
MTLEIIQIVEDDQEQAHLLDHILRKASFRTTVASDGGEGWQSIEHLRPSLVLLDVMLPVLDGFTLCRRLRDDTRFQDLPIILLSALGNEEHRVAGFEVGADDYIAKPFSPREVVARVQAVLMRNRPPLPGGERLLNGELMLETGHCVAHIGGHTLSLNGAEGVVLRRLAERADQIVSGDELAALVWGKDGMIRERQLTHLVTGLRLKLEKQGVVIEVLPSMAYRLRAAFPRASATGPASLRLGPHEPSDRLI